MEQTNQLNSNFITNKDINYEGINPKKTGTQEKILNLPTGGKECRKICIVFGISVLILIATIVTTVTSNNPIFLIGLISIIGILYAFIKVTCCNGFFTVNPNEAVVFQYYGKYLGTVKENGFFYGLPLAKKTRVSLRSNQFNGNKLKVNEREGNPVELGIIVVWRIGDTAKAVFDVIGYEQFIHTQSESAIRFIGCKYPYEPTVKGEISLRGRKK